jgi:hypothetical protein
MMMLISKDSRAAQWVSWDQLIDKLMFLAVSGDGIYICLKLASYLSFNLHSSDPAFISRFLLTYRRFATPRQILVSIQTRLRQLEESPGDPMLACYAQMRICALLKTWIDAYPSDFAVRGTASSLNSVVKFILSKTYLLQYGCDFIPFLELLPGSEDQDSDWALKPDDGNTDSEEDDDAQDLNEHVDETSTPGQEEPLIDSSSQIQGHRNSMIASTILSRSSPPPTAVASRDRKLSLPITKVPALANSSTPKDSLTSLKPILRELQKCALHLASLEPDDVAREITKYEMKLFLQIEVRMHVYKIEYMSQANVCKAPALDAILYQRQRG